MEHIGRHDRLLREHTHDPYKQRLKHEGLLVCPTCGAVYHSGRWEWRASRPSGANDETCPACRRIADDCPAGILRIEGRFAAEHSAEIDALIRNEAAAEQSRHPLNRIISVIRQDDGIVVTTTEIHLVRRLGEALRHAHHGELSFQYVPEKYLVRVRWTR